MGEKLKIALAEDPAGEPDIDKILSDLGIRDNPSKVGFFGGGQAGTKVVEMLTDMLDPAEHSAVHIFAANTDTKPFARMIRKKEDTAKYFLSWLKFRKERFDLIPLGIDGTGAGGDPKVSATAFEEPEAQARIRKMIEGLKALFMVNGMGGGTGTGVAIKAAEMIKDMRKDVAIFSILIMPFEFEEEGRTAIAVDGRQRTAEHVCIITIYNESIYDGGKGKEKGGDINDDIEAVNRNIITPLLETTHQLTLATAVTINRDLKDLRYIGDNKEAYIACATCEEKEPIEKTLERLLHDPAQDWSIVERSDRGILIFKGPFSKEESAKATTLITGTMRKGKPDRPIRLIPGFDRSSDGKKRLYFICSSPELQGPKTDWAKPAERRQEEVRAAKLAAIASECETMGIEDLIGPNHKQIKVLQQGGHAEYMDVSENFAKFWNWFWAEWKNWPREKQREKWQLAHVYLTGHQSHVTPYPPPELRAAAEEVEVDPETEKLRKRGLAHVTPPKKNKKGFFRR